MILTPDQRLRVFISSTLDLVEARAAARGAVESLGLTPVMFETGARPHPPRALYSAYVRQSDVFVAVYSRRYGWTAPDMAISGLEDEFELSDGKPRLVYLDAGADPEPRMRRFLERVQSGGLSYRRFRSPEELAAVLRADLVVLLSERFHSTRSDPLPRAPDAAALPVPLTTFVGRAQELSALHDLIVAPAGRLVTLTGPGGVGKTRLAIEAARGVDDAFRRTFYVPLEALREPQLLGQAVATALDLALPDSSADVQVVTGVLRGEPTLLVLDNFEQVLPAASVVGEMLRRAPLLHVLVTSRAPLRIEGEREVPVQPLAGGADGTGSDSDPVRLFLDRARAVRPDFALDDVSTREVAELCRELDDLPLAIELAAAMVRVMSPQTLLARVRGGARNLTGSRRDAPDRHRGLDAAVGWSHDLLDGPERALLAELSVFRGGFTIETAERVSGRGAGVLEGVSKLVEQSLVRARIDPSAGARFSMLQTVRHFAAQRLAELPQHREVLHRHAEVFLELVERVGGPAGHEAAVLDAVEVELDNVRRAFEWQLELGRVDPVAEAVWHSWWFWWSRGFLPEGRLWAQRCLHSPALGPHSRMRVRAADGLLAIWSADYAAAAAALAEATAGAAEAGDLRTRAYTELGLGLVRGLTGAVDEGSDLIARGRARFERSGDDTAADLAIAAACWLRGITREFEGADELFDEATARVTSSGSALEAGLIRSALAQYLMTRGEFAVAVRTLSDALEDLSRTRHIGSVILALEVVAELALATGETADGVRVLAATAATRTAIGTRVPPRAAARLESLLAMGRARLQGGEFDETLAAGTRLVLADAVEHGRSILARLASTPGRITRS